ncbi:MAG TPA: hypothetical protein VJ506_03900 [Candidatus Limnocylindrales bacterium]|nr:hypothetical protein [Candidatus Limnocylindrales bacterium]
MNARPRSVPIFIVVGAVAWVALTIGAAVVVIQSPEKNAGLGLGLVLIWVVLLVFAGVERWTGGRAARP